MTRRLVLFTLFCFFGQMWAPLAAGEPADVWGESPFRDVAVEEMFSHTSFANYDDVAVIINNMSAASREIGYAFAENRSIPSERILLLTNESTPTGETINAQQFTDFFATPIETMIQDRGLTELNVLVTTKGVPLRVNGGTNARAAFDAELALIGGNFASSIFQNWHVASNYGPAAGNPMKAFERAEQGYYLVTRLTGYDVATALELIERANGSFGQRGEVVLDLATNRNGSGYKWWNDLLYTTNQTMHDLGEPVFFDQNTTFITDRDDVMLYTSWGSNDGNWNANYLPNSGYDTADAAWETGSRFWNRSDPALSPGEQWYWSRQTAVKRNGAAAMEGVLTPAACTAGEASETNGLLAEYFDNDGHSFNRSLMPDLTNRTPDRWQHESNIDQPAAQSAWPGLDERFRDHWAVRHTGILHIPWAGNWTFYLNSDDGTKLWLDDVEVVNNEGEHPMREVSDTVWLDAGEHDFRTEFFEWGGWAGFTLSWETDNLSKQVVPSSAFTRGSATPVNDANLVHHWRFDETSGNVALDAVGDADLNFTGTNGSQWQSCVLGNCAFFDGVDDVARVDVSDVLTDFTVSLWVQANTTGQPRFSSVLAVNDVGGDDDSFQIMTSGQNPGDWQLYHNNSYDFGEVDDTVWQHLVATFTNDTVRLYLDGVHTNTIPVPNGTVNSIELYKFGVNRAGNAHFEGVIDEVQVWDVALSPDEIDAVNDEIVWLCTQFNTTNPVETSVEQTWTFGDEMKGHAWILYGYAQRAGWVAGDWWLEVEAYDSNGTLLSVNSSSEHNLADSWNSRTVRFRPHENATSFVVKQIAELESGTQNGSVYFDQTNLRAIRPHFTWMDGALAETAVSTGGRSFNWGTGYGQSLVADLLEDGVSGVKGYVYEPYLSAISNPDQLFTCYVQGYTMAECYAASNVMLSWMGTVVGDPKMAPYADRLHDINISAVRAPERLSLGENGTLEILLENLAPGNATGWLEVVDRQGNVVLANHSMVIPGGNLPGSRLIHTVDVTMLNAPYVDLQVRWIAAGGPGASERVLDNNIAYLSIEVNTAPVLDDWACSTTIAYRGGVVLCSLELTDDYGIERVNLTWNLAGQNSTSLLPATSTDGGLTWVVTVNLPIDLELGWVNLSVEMVDIHGLVTTADWPAAFEVRDAPATWYGPHVSGVDPTPWGGTTQPAAEASGWVRGQPHLIRACVLDADHVPDAEAPQFRIDNSTLAGVTMSGASGGQTCYAVNWAPTAGIPLSPVNLTLVRDGATIHSRLLHPIDLPPVVDITSEAGFLTGANDVLRLNLSDPDDPLSTHDLSLEIQWPGAGMTSHDLPGLAVGEHFIEVGAPTGLEQGDAQLSITYEGGSASTILPVRMMPPVLGEARLCSADGLAVDHLVRGMPGTIIIAHGPGRNITNGMVTISADGSSAVAPVTPLTGPVPADCVITGASGWTHYTLELDRGLLLSPRLPIGAATLTITLTDVDGLTGQAAREINIQGAPINVDFGELPETAFGGTNLTIFASIEDADASAQTACLFVIRAGAGHTLYNAEFNPSAASWHTIWQTPLADAGPYNLEMACTDESGHADGDAWNLTHVNPPVTEPPTTGGEVTGESEGFPLWVSAIVGFLLIATLALTAFAVTRTEEDVFEEEAELEASDWSQSAGEISDAALAEMAGIDQSEQPAEGLDDILGELEEDEPQWNDEDLLAAGWTEDQIATHRAENATVPEGNA